MNFADLKAFVAVAEAGSVSRAAAKLNLTQPAVSRRVQVLEASLGVALLDRSLKPPRLTTEGRLALDCGRKVLLAVDDLSSRVANGEMAGEFRLGVAPGFAETVLGEPLDAIIRAFPNLVPRVIADWSVSLLGALQDDRLDAALVLLTEPQLHRNVVQFRMFRSDSVAVVAPRRMPISASSSILELGPHPWVLNPRGCGFRAALQRAVDAGRGHLNICAEVQGYDLQLSLIARGVGLGLAPLARLKVSPLRQELRVLSPRDFRLSATVALATGPRQSRFSSVIDVLIARIEALGRKKNANIACKL